MDREGCIAVGGRDKLLMQELGKVFSHIPFPAVPASESKKSKKPLILRT